MNHKLTLVSFLNVENYPIWCNHSYVAHVAYEIIIIFFVMNFRGQITTKETHFYR